MTGVIYYLHFKIKFYFSVGTANEDGNHTPFRAPQNTPVLALLSHGYDLIVGRVGLSHIIDTRSGIL